MAKFALLALLAVALGIAFSEVARRARRATRARQALALWRLVSPRERAAALEGLLAEDHRLGVAWFLLGCLHARRGEFAIAARLFGMAHHADPDLASAALLTFTCLKTAGGGATATARLAETWAEMKRPAVGESEVERAVWAALEADGAANGGDPLSRLARIVFLPPDAPA